MRMVNAVALLLVGTAAVSLAQSEPQSLGDVARQNKPGKKAVRVFGQGDFTPAVEDNSSSGAPSPTGDHKKADSAASAPKTVGESRSLLGTDSPDVARLKNQIKLLKQEQDGWRDSAKKYEALLATDVSDFRRDTYQTALSNDRQNVQICQQKIDQAQADLAKAEKAAGSSQKTVGQSATN